MLSDMLQLVVILIALGRSIASDSKVGGGKIAGGTLADIKNFPFQVSLQFNGEHGCGASIISSEWILTAAHCVKGESLSTMQLRVGSSFHASGGSVHKVIFMQYHPQYNRPYRLDYDIAVLKVSPALSFTDSVQAIILDDSSVAPGVMATVSGWGFLQEDQHANSPQLRQVSIPIINHDLCDNEYYPDAISPRMICAGYENGGKDACQNDSGGPLTAGGKLVGVVSWGRGCAEPDSPGVYTSVSVLREWIKTNTGV